MSVSGIESVGFQPYVAPTMSPSSVTSTSGTSGAGSAFGDMVLDGLDRLESVQDKSDKLAVQAATGDLDDIHDYTIAAAEASTAIELTAAVRNKAVEAFSEIMRMQA